MHALATAGSKASALKTAAVAERLTAAYGAEAAAEIGPHLY